MSSKFQELQDKHVRLLERYESHKESQEFLKEVREYTEEVINASREIGDSRERNQLRANLRFWGAYIYDHTGTYPNLTLLPSEAGSATPIPKTRTPNRSGIIIASVFLMIFIFVVVWGTAFNRTYSQQPGVTNTPIDPNLFATQPGQTPTISMSDVANFATSTSMEQSLNPSTATAGAAFTQIAFATATPGLPFTGGEGGIFLGHAFSSTEIGDDTACSSHLVNIIMIHDFASDKSVEPVTLTVSEEGSFRKIMERLVSLNDGRELSDGSKEINTEINISNASGSYLIYVDHPKLTFDSVIIQHLPDCQGNLTAITYDIPTDDYDELERRPSLGVNFGLVVWGPYPEIDPELIHDGVAKIQVSNTGGVAGNILWVSEGSEDFEPLQNNEFIAYSLIDYLIGVTSGGRTILIPFRIETPYLGYLQNK